MFEVRNPNLERRFHRQSWLLAVAVVLATAALLIALYLQQAWQLYPCPLCILQRYAFLALAISAAAALWCKRGRTRTTLTGASLLFCLAGLAAAGRHIWVLLHPAEGCGRDRLAELVNDWVVARWLPQLFAATGSCIDEIPPLLGLSLPVWALLLFGGLVIGLATVLGHGGRQ